MNDFVRVLTKMIPSIRQDELDLIKQGELTGQRRQIQGERTVPVNIHWAEKNFAPVLFEIHGGGFVFSSELKNDALCEYISKEMDINVVSIGYSKAPENPYPAAVEDVYYVIKYFYDNSEAEQVDKNAFAVLGFSAGANLAVASSMLNKQRNGYKICAQALHYPFLDAVTPPDEKPRYSCDIPVEMVEVFIQSYSKEEERALPTVSPVMAKKEDVEGSAPTLVITAEKDALKAEGEEFATMLKAAGADVICTRMVNAHHGYIEDWFNPIVYVSMPEDKKQTHDSEFGKAAQDAVDTTIEFLNIKFGYKKRQITN